MIATCVEFESYGYRRVGPMRHRAIVVNSKKIRCLMREHDLQPAAVAESQHLNDIASMPFLSTVPDELQAAGHVRIE
jgi:hypothetical protein